MLRKLSLSKILGPVLVSILVSLPIAGPARADEAWDRAVAAVRAGELATAISALEIVTERHTDYGPGHAFLGRVLLRDGQLEPALAALDRALELEPADQPSRLMRATALIALEHWDEASETLAEVPLETLGEGERTQWTQGLAALVARAPAETDLSGLLARGLQASPGDPRLWEAGGRWHSERGDETAAVDAWMRAAAVDPTLERREGMLRRSFSLAVGLEREGRKALYRRVASAAEEWSEVSPTNSLLVAEGWIGAGDCDAADRWLEVSEPGAVTSLYRGQCAASRGDHTLASVELEAVLRERSADDSIGRRARRSLARVHHARGEYERAATLYAEIGDREGVEAMRKAKRIADDNTAIDARTRECRELRQSLQATLTENAALLGEEDLAGLRFDLESRLRDCRAYFDDVDPGAPVLSVE